MEQRGTGNMGAGDREDPSIRREFRRGLEDMYAGMLVSVSIAWLILLIALLITVLLD